MRHTRELELDVDLVAIVDATLDFHKGLEYDVLLPFDISLAEEAIARAKKSGRKKVCLSIKHELDAKLLKSIEDAIDNAMVD